MLMIYYRSSLIIYPTTIAFRPVRTYLKAEKLEKISEIYQIEEHFLECDRQLQRSIE
jgi:hypothetical protein